jgi:hypothetical protein
MHTIGIVLLITGLILLVYGGVGSRLDPKASGPAFVAVVGLLLTAAGIFLLL